MFGPTEDKVQQGDEECREEERGRNIHKETVNPGCGLALETPQAGSHRQGRRQFRGGVV